MEDSRTSLAAFTKEFFEFEVFCKVGYWNHSNQLSPFFSKKAASCLIPLPRTTRGADPGAGGTPRPHPHWLPGTGSGRVGRKCASRAVGPVGPSADATPAWCEPRASVLMRFRLLPVDDTRAQRAASAGGAERLVSWTRLPVTARGGPEPRLCPPYTCLTAGTTRD